MDWTEPFRCGNAPQDAAGGSAILTLLYAEACPWLAGLEPDRATQWRQQARSLVRATLRHCWDARRRLLADTAGQASFSVHAQVQAILAASWPATRARAILNRALDATTITQPGTFYYRYYVMQALKQAGLRERFFALLAPWEQSLHDSGFGSCARRPAWRWPPPG